MSSRRIVVAALSLVAAAGLVRAQEAPKAVATPAPKRNLQIDDLFRLKTVGNPQIRDRKSVV